MEKKLFDIIKDYDNMTNALYFKLEKELGMEKTDELLEEFDDYSSKILKLGKYLDESKLIEEDGFLKREYEGIPSYTKVVVLYHYDNGYSLCETTSGLTMLVPTDLISHETI